MPSWFEVGNIWKTLREIDLRPIRAEAEQITTLAIVGGSEVSRGALIHTLCRRPDRLHGLVDASQSGPEPTSIDIDSASAELTADLIVLLLDPGSSDHTREIELLGEWRRAGKRVVILADHAALVTGPDGFAGQGSVFLEGSTGDNAFLEREFVAGALSLLPDRSLSLARYYPLFRIGVGQKLISETSIANATYSLSTGLAEIIPILDVPFNLADIIILTKAQAIMAYKLGLALGLPGNWQEHMTAFGSTLGSGFVFRQVARQLIGLIPVWGIIPKVAVAYAGTYVLGEAIMQWYLTGRRVTPSTMRKLYKEALDRGKSIARNLLPRKSLRQKRLPLISRARAVCANCGMANPGEYNYCGNCGSPLRVPT